MPDHAAIAPSQIAASRQIALLVPVSNVTPVFGAYANHPASDSERSRLMATASTARKDRGCDDDCPLPFLHHRMVPEPRAR